MSSAAMVSMRQMCGCTLAMVLVLSSVLISVHGLHDGGANKAIQFNGNTIAVVGSTTTAGSSVFNIDASAFTLSMWVKTSTSAGMLWFKSQSTQNYNVYDCGAATAKNRLEFYTMCIQPNGRVRSFIQSYGGHYTQKKAQPSSQGSAVSSTSITDDQWHFVVTRRVNTATHQVGVDGTFVSYSRTDGNTNVQIPSKQATYVGARGFNGLIDDIRFWQSSITDSALNQAMRSTNDEFSYAYFNFDAGNMVCVNQRLADGGIVAGTATYSTNHAPTNLDCAGVWGGTKKYDACGVCDGPVTAPVNTKALDIVDGNTEASKLVTLRYTEVAKCAGANFAANYITASFSQLPNGVQLQPTVTTVSVDKNNARWDITYNATVTGSYTLIVSTPAGLVPLPQNPYTLSKVPTTPLVTTIPLVPSGNIVSGDADVVFARALLTDVFSNPIVDEGAVNFQVAAQPGLTVTSSHIASALGSLFSLTARCLKAVSTTLNVRLGANVVNSIPLRCVAAAPNVGKTQTNRTTSHTVVVNTPTTIEVQTRDTQENPSNVADTQHVFVILSNADGTQVDNKTSTQVSQGVYRTSVTTTTAGTMTWRAYVAFASQGVVQVGTGTVAYQPGGLHIPSTTALPSNPSTTALGLSTRLSLLLADQFGNLMSSVPDGTTVHMSLVGPSATVNGSATPALELGASAVAANLTFGAAGTYTARVDIDGTLFSTQAFSLFVAGNANATSISPKVGFAGTKVSVFGTNFARTVCRFGVAGNATSEAEVVSLTHVRCTAPAYNLGAIVPVYVANGASAPFSLAQQQFRYINTPAVTSVVPTGGPVFGGFDVTFVGVDFVNTDTLACRMGTGTSSTVQYVSSTMVVCTAPASEVGLGTAAVANDGQKFSNALEFRYREPFSEQCRQTTELPSGVVDRQALGLTYFGNLATEGSISAHSNLTGTGTKAAMLVDGDRCCRNVNGTRGIDCGANFAQAAAAADSLASVTLRLKKDAFVNNVVSSWYRPCRNEPKADYEVYYQSTDGGAWQRVVQRVLGAEVGVPQPCTVVPSDNSDVSLCIDFFPVTRMRSLRLQFNNSQPIMGTVPSSTDGGWLYELEAHGVYVDTPRSVQVQTGLNLTVSADTQVSLPTIDVATANLEGTPLGAGDTITQGRAVTLRLLNAAQQDVTSSILTTTGASTFAIGAGVANLTGLGLRAPQAGVYNLWIDVTGLASGVVRIEVNVGTPRNLTLCAGSVGSSVTVHAEATTALPSVALCLRDGGNNDIGATDPGNTITASLTTVPFAVVLGGTTVVASTQGRATLGNLHLASPRAAIYAMAFTAPGLTSVHVQVQVLAGLITRVVLASGGAVTVRSAPTVRLDPILLVGQDAGGNVAVNATGTLVHLSSNNSTQELVWTATTQRTVDTNARANVSDLVLVRPRSGVYTFAFTAFQLTGDTLTVTVQPGTPVALRLEGNLAQAGVNVTLPSSPSSALPSVSLVAVDAADTPVGALDQGTREVRANLYSANGVDATAYLGGASLTRVMVQANLTFDGLVVRNAPTGTYTLSLSTLNLVAANVTVVVVTGAPASIVATPSESFNRPQGSLVDLSVPSVSVRISDSGGNLLDAASLNGRQVSIALVARPAGAVAAAVVLNGTTTRAFDGTEDHIDWVQLSLFRPSVGGYTLRFTSPGLTSQQLTLQVTVGPPAELGVVVDGGSGSAITLGARKLNPLPAVRIQSRDAGGALTNVEVERVNVSVSQVVLGSEPLLTLLGIAELPLNDTDGTALLDGLSLANPPHGTYTFEVGDIDPQTTIAPARFTVRIVTGPAYALRVTSTAGMAPLPSMADTALPELKIATVDATNASVGTADVDHTVALALIQSPSSQQQQLLRGTLSIGMLGGTAAFIDLSLVRPLKGAYVVDLSAAGLVSTQWTFTVVTGAASTVRLDTVGGASGSNLIDVAYTGTGTSVALPDIVLAIVDAGGNVVNDTVGRVVSLQEQQQSTQAQASVVATATATAAASAASVLVSGNTQVTLGAGGQGTLSGIHATARAGSYDLFVASVGLDKAAVVLTVRPGPAHRLVLAQSVAAVLDNGVNLSPAPKVHLHDAVDNRINDTGTLVGIALESGSGSSASLSGDTTVAFVAGTAVFDNVRLLGRYGNNYTLVMSQPGGIGSLGAVRMEQVRIRACVEVLPFSEPESVLGRTCLCAPGFFETVADDGVSRRCQRCDSGSYNPNQGASRCNKCPGNTDTGGLFAQTSRDVCRCKPGFFQVGSDKTDCNPCRKGAVCTGGASIIPSSGFWRVSQTSRVFYDCPNPAACVGGANDTCAQGYEGPLCSVCSPGYGKFGSTCSACGPAATNWFLVLVFFGLAIVLLYFLVSTASGPKSEFSIIVKIMLNYLQVIAFVGDFNTRWPALVQGLFDTMGLALLSLNVHPVNCAFGLTYFQRFSLYMTFPLIGVGAPAILFTIVYLRRMRKAQLSEQLEDTAIDESATGFTLQIGARGQVSETKRTKVRRHAVRYFSVTVLVTLFLAHPVITKQVFQIFNCAEFDQDQTFLWTDLSISCKSPEYLYHQAWGWFMVVGYCAGLPLMGLALLTKNRSRLYTSETIQQRYRFLYEGFRPKRYFWEIVVLLRKLLVVAVIVFFSRRPLTQIYSGLWVVVFALVFHLYMRPMSSALTSRLETSSLVVTVVTLMSGMLYFRPEEVDEDSSVILSIVLVLMNTILLLTFVIILAKGLYEMSKKQKMISRMANLVSTQMKNIQDISISEAHKQLNIATTQEVGRTYKNVGEIRRLLKRKDQSFRSSRMYRMKDLVEEHDADAVVVEVTQFFTPFVDPNAVIDADQLRAMYAKAGAAEQMAKAKNRKSIAMAEISVGHGSVDTDDDEDEDENSE